MIASSGDPLWGLKAQATLCLLLLRAATGLLCVPGPLYKCLVPGCAGLHPNCSLRGPHAVAQVLSV